MAKKMIKSILKNSSEEIELELSAIVLENKISYMEKDTMVNIYINDDIVMKRTNNFSAITFNFKKNEYTKCIYEIEGKALELNIYTNKLVVEDNYLEIDYIIEEENINFKMFIM